MLPESSLAECTKLYPVEDDQTEKPMNNDKEDEDDDDNDDEDIPKPSHHHHHHHGHHHHHHGKHPCIVECYFNKTGMFKDRQVVKTTVLKQFSANSGATGNLQATLSSAIDTCIAERKDFNF